jgi:transposase
MNGFQKSSNRRWEGLIETKRTRCTKHDPAKEGRRVLRRTLEEDEICRRLMTIPGVGPLVAITFKSAIDDPGRIAKSKTVGALFRLVPKKYQSGERDVSGGITRTGDESVRTALYEAANVMLTRTTRFSSLKRWALEVAKRRGLKRARVALARKLAVVLHRIWVDGTTFRWTKPNPAIAG